MSDVVFRKSAVRKAQMCSELTDRVHQTNRLKGYCHLNGDSCKVYEKGIQSFCLTGVQFKRCMREKKTTWNNTNRKQEKTTNVWSLYETWVVSLILADCPINHFSISSIPRDYRHFTLNLERHGNWRKRKPRDQCHKSNKTR